MPTLPSRREFIGSAALVGLAYSAGRLNAETARAAQRWPGPPLPVRVANVNTTSIRAAVELGCRTMGRVFNADDHDVPFFNSEVWPEAVLGFSSSSSDAHVPGRHLNALLTARAVVGVSVPEAVIAKHARAAFFSYSGPIPLPLNRLGIGGPLRHFLPHNLREGFHALYALTKYCQSARARELAERSIAAINRWWSPATGWDRAYLEGKLGLEMFETPNPFIGGIARAMGPLVKYYHATGYRPALDLALVLKEKAIREAFLADGAYTPERLGTHGHSITCVMSSLAQVAVATGDAALLERMRRFFGHGLKQIGDDLGWSLEVPTTTTDPDRGEANNSGDILETCLLLGQNGYPQYLHQAERALRCHLLPCQLRDTSFIVNPSNPRGEDGKRDVADRHLGAYGFPAPYGHLPVEGKKIGFNMDIVGGTVASLCEAYRAMSSTGAAGHRVNLLFDHETADIAIESPYGRSALGVVVKRPAPLAIRIPPWIDRARIRLEGWEGAPRYEGDYLVLVAPPVGRRLRISFALVRQDLVLQHKTRAIPVRLYGDQVSAMEAFGAPLAFFDPL